MKLSELRALEERATKGPFIWTQTLTMTIEEQVDYMRAHLYHGIDGPMNGVGCVSHPKTIIGADPSRPKHMVEIATCGNGPNGENNAKYLAVALDALPLLLDLWAAVKCYDTCDQMVRGEAYRDIQNALAALEAAR